MLASIVNFLPLAATESVPMFWVVVTVATVGGWLVLRLVGAETEAQRKQLEADHQRQLHAELMAVQQASRSGRSPI